MKSLKGKGGCNRRAGSEMLLLYNVAKKIKARLTVLERTKLIPGKGAVTRTIGLPTSLPVPLFL